MSNSFAIDFFLIAVGSALFIFLSCHGFASIIRSFRARSKDAENENKIAKFVMFPPTLDFPDVETPEDPDEFN